MAQLPIDCLNEMFECLENKVDLSSYLLVNRLWCKISIRILWRTIQNHNILISCLPDKSKKLLQDNGLMILTSTSKPPLFNYIGFIQTLSMNDIYENIHTLQDHDRSKQILMIQEVFKMFMNRMSLKKLVSYLSPFKFSSLPFT